MSGWIKLYRAIQDHWVFQDAEYFRAWCIILMRVNHEPKKALIHGKIYECDRGQSLLSLNSWVEEFGVSNWSIRKVRTFFKLLENDHMITTEGMQKTTRLTVCNYESYQDVRQANDKQTTDRRQANDRQTTTTKELKNDKKDKKYIYGAKYQNGTSSREFYDSEIESNQDGSLIEKYKMIADYIMNLDVVPKMEKQLSYKGFVTCYGKAKEYGYKLSDYLISMDNWKEGKSGKNVAQLRTDVSKTLQTWIRNDAERSRKI